MRELILHQFEHCRSAVYGAFSRLTLISLQFSTCQSAPGAPALAGGVYFTRPDSCRAARSAGRPRELRGERTGIPISLSGSDRNWNHFDVRAHLVPILPFISVCNWNHFVVRAHLVPIPSFIPSCNWNHFVVRAHLVPILPLISACNWNHSGSELHLVPILPLISACNWNHFGSTLHLVPILPLISACNWNHSGLRLGSVQFEVVLDVPDLSCVFSDRAVAREEGRIGDVCEGHLCPSFLIVVHPAHLFPYLHV